MAKLERKPGWEHLPDYFFYDYGVCTPRVEEMLKTGTTKQIAKMFFNEWYDPNFSGKPHTIAYQDAREILVQVQDSPREKEFKKWRAVYYAFYSIQPIISEQARIYEQEIEHLNSWIKDLEAWETIEIAKKQYRAEPSPLKYYIPSGEVIQRLIKEELDREAKTAKAWDYLFNDLAALKDSPIITDKEGRPEIDLKTAWQNVRKYVEAELIPTAGVFYAGVLAVRMWAKKIKGADFYPYAVIQDLELRDKNYLDLIIDDKIKLFRAKRRGEIIPKEMKEDALAFTPEQRGGNGKAYEKYLKRLQDFYEVYL